MELIIIIILYIIIRCLPDYGEDQEGSDLAVRGGLEGGEAQGARGSEHQARAHSQAHLGAGRSGGWGRGKGKEQGAKSRDRVEKKGKGAEPHIGAGCLP